MFPIQLKLLIPTQSVWDCVVEHAGTYLLFSSVPFFPSAMGKQTYMEIGERTKEQ